MVEFGNTANDEPAGWYIGANVADNFKTLQVLFFMQFFRRREAKARHFFNRIRVKAASSLKGEGGFREEKACSRLPAQTNPLPEVTDRLFSNSFAKLPTKLV